MQKVEMVAVAKLKLYLNETLFSEKKVNFNSPTTAYYLCGTIISKTELQIHFLVSTLGYSKELLSRS